MLFQLYFTKTIPGRHRNKLKYKHRVDGLHPYVRGPNHCSQDWELAGGTNRQKKSPGADNNRGLCLYI